MLQTPLLFPYLGFVAFLHGFVETSLLVAEPKVESKTCIGIFFVPFTRSDILGLCFSI